MTDGSQDNRLNHAFATARSKPAPGNSVSTGYLQHYRAVRGRVSIPAGFTGRTGTGVPVVLWDVAGGVSGIIGAYLMLHPRVKVIVLVLMRVPLRLPAYWIIGFWIGLQIFSIVTGVKSDTAWWAHIGGLIAGAIMIPFFKRDSVPLFDRGTRH
jgi:hypothetical protein